MLIKSLHITAFGGLRDRDIELCDGINVIGGGNEVGKTSAAMFIKFIFYGLNSKATRADGASERTRYINRDTSQAAGHLIAVAQDGVEYRIERSLTASDGTTPRERIRITDLTSGKTVSGQEPGEYFFGVPESVFTGTAFVSQNRPVKPELAGGGGKGSVENLLTSADENVDIKRAVKRLDDVRRELLHKRGSGGEISDLREQRAALVAERRSCGSRAAEIMSATASASDIKKHIAEQEEAAGQYERVFDSLGKIELKRKFDSLDATANSISDIANSIKLIDSSPVGGSFREELLSAERVIRANEEEEAAFEEKSEFFPEEEDDVVIPDASEVIDGIMRSAKKTKLMFTLAVALILCGCAAALASVAMYLLSVQRFMLPFGAAVVFALVGIALLILRTPESSRLADALDEWGADSPSELETAVYDRIGELERLQDAIDGKRDARELLRLSRERREAAEETICSLAEKVNANRTSDVHELIKQLGTIAQSAHDEREALIAKSNKLKGRLETIAEQLEGVDRNAVVAEVNAALATAEGKLAASLTPESVKELAKKKEFNETALRAAIKRKAALDERLTELGKLTRTPDEIETMISTLDERIEELSLRLEACSMAQTAIERAGESMRSGVIPRIGARASEIISDCTEKYSRLTVDGAFECGLGDGDDAKSSEYFSRGTGDLAYIALRIALAEEVFRGESPTLIFDESFAHVDSDRIKNVLRMLDKGRGQDMVFTCRREETDIARDLGYNVIEL